MRRPPSATPAIVAGGVNYAEKRPQEQAERTIGPECGQAESKTMTGNSCGSETVIELDANDVGPIFELSDQRTGHAGNGCAYRRV